MGLILKKPLPGLRRSRGQPSLFQICPEQARGPGQWPSMCPHCNSININSNFKKCKLCYFILSWRPIFSFGRKPWWTVRKQRHTSNRLLQQNSSRSSCRSLLVRAHLLDWLSVGKLAVDSKCFHSSLHCELSYTKAALGKKDKFIYDSSSWLSITLCLSCKLCLCLLLVSLSFTAHLRLGCERVKSIIPAAAEIFAAISNTGFAQVSL